MPTRRRTGTSGIKTRSTTQARRGSPTTRARAAAPGTRTVSKTQRSGKTPKTAKTQKTQRSQPQTRRTGGSRGTGRFQAAGYPKKNNLPLILGISGGGLLVFILIIAAAAGGGDGGNNSSFQEKKPSNDTAPVDVSGLERSGKRKCQEGLATVQASEPKFTRDLSLGEKRALKSDLKRAREKLRQGLNDLESAMMKSGKRYDVTQYQNAFTTINKKINELPD